MTLNRDTAYSSGALPQAQTPRPAAKMPPMGQFDPPSTSKENKKRRGGPGASTTQGAASSVIESGLPQSNRGVAAQVGNASKRQKISHQRLAQPETIPVSPTLIPQLPEPLPPYPSLPTTQEELGFFDRVKKQIGNRSSYAEFLKLINLFSQDLIDKYTLADRVVAFIGSNNDLMTWFKNFMSIEEQDDVIEARARPDPGRVNLSHCRAFGPSYRHLPKRDQNKTCKGRDGMCYEVLNDVWASHPTWASEDSGFIAHRKNQYEEALHRIEEERHDYDFHIESCQRTIQLMEPLVQQIGVMSEADRQAFQLAPGLGGASEAIPKRIIMKIYGREPGAKVLQEMFARPTAVLPIVLSRLKQKLEEWKSVQREWEKVWRDQIHKAYYKSLDHQGINAKNVDKKNFQQKTLTSEIQAKYEERRKTRDQGISGKKHQLEYKFEDLDIIADASRLVVACLESDRTTYNPGEQERIKGWFLDFVTRFFNLDSDVLRDRVFTGLPKAASDVEDGHESDVAHPPRGKNKPKNTADFLRRQAIDRRNGKEDSTPFASKESTPMPDAASEAGVEDEAMTIEPPTEQPKRPWITVTNSEQSAQKLALDDSYTRDTFNLYANTNIYCFFRLFETLVSRLAATKKNEPAVQDAIARYHGIHGRRKPAINLHMVDKGPDAFFYNINGRQNYYSQVLQMCEQVLTGTMDLSHLEETLRRYYNRSGWQLYTLDKLVTAILRFVMNILGGDAKDKSVDITNLFIKDREKPDTTRAQEIQYRKTVERMSKDGEVYRISYVSHTRQANFLQTLTFSQTPINQICTIRLFPSGDATFDSDDLSNEAQWSYYVASYSMTDDTEGVNKEKMTNPCLRRAIPPQHADPEAAYEQTYGNISHSDEQSAFIVPETYKLLLSKDYGFERHGVKQRKRYHKGKVRESEKFTEKFVRNVAWMKDQRAEDVERRKQQWEKGVKEDLYAFGVDLNT